MRLLIVGHGRMGQLVEGLAPDYGFEVAGILEIDSNADGGGVTPERCRGVDVAVDFSTAEATVATAPRLAAAGVSLVVGTTGWQDQEAARSAPRWRARGWGRWWPRTSRSGPT